MTELLLSITIFMTLHISAMAIFVKLCGVKIKEITYGAGPTLARIGIFQFKPLPLSGYVKTLDSRESEVSEKEKRFAFNHQPVWVQVFVPLSGCLFLLILSILIQGENVMSSFIGAFPQMIFGAFSPLSEAQNLIREAHLFIQKNSLLTVIVIAQTKLVAFNPLPLTIFNGGQAIVGLIKWGKSSTNWETVAAQVSLVIAIVLIGSWLTAIIYYAW
ncbi:site-2 protease family protein [Aliikangiella coralliicola]|uniref:Peptidase M50 domain-containing protein n=1 Tax=Aliikangiella coralliicola TaxID=2592383 RepID=A0A545UII4_9GAMM|nr:site-2 protease family protein [Aliikangiella coralliicola]TQV89284.1 hypothetical protein FLL46_03900 [Aliikangiella coralliicola]